MLKITSYIFYIIAITAAFFSSFQVLEQIFPEYGLFHLLVGFIGTTMFFPIIPIYPAFNDGDWSYLIICYSSILIGVILGNRAKSNK
tara:strand:- start:5568 stop:5828 length:261 start_codon:yes stop_codon:yes gene_type:complete